MAATYTPISTYTLSSGATTVSFTSIPSIYTDLVLVANCTYNGSTNWYLRFNNDSNSYYSKTVLYGTGSGSGASARNTSQTETYINVSNGNTSDPNMFEINVMNYANTNTYKTFLCRENTATQSVGSFVGLYRSTSAINRIDLTLYTSSTAGATFSLYGILAA